MSQLTRLLGLFEEGGNTQVGLGNCLCKPQTSGGLGLDGQRD